MITFITAFRTFDETFGPIQRSALFSYKANGIPVVAPDMEPSVLAECNHFGNIFLLKGIKTAQDLGFKNSSPILKDMLMKCLKEVKTQMVGLINSDVLIPLDFMKDYPRILNKYGDGAFIAVTRHEVNLTSEITGIKKLRAIYKQDAVVYDESSSSDLFITSKKNFCDIAGSIPEFVLGRYAWDNWLHYYAATTFPSYNGTKRIKILHCRHTHNHIVEQEGKPGRSAPSSAYNISLLRSMQEQYGSTIRVNDWKEIE